MISRSHPKHPASKYDKKDVVEDLGITKMYTVRTPD